MKVLAPPTLNALQEQVRGLHALAAPWLPAGLGSRLDWGPAIAAGTAVLSCRKLSGIHEHNPGDFTLTVAAGTPLVEVQEALAHHRQWLCLDLPWGATPSSIGGLVARGLAGGYRQRYLGVRDQLLGVQLLRSDGVLARAGGKVVKNVAGYDLMRLLCGSWGALALITELTLRTQPIPPQRCSLLIQGELPVLQQLCRWLRGSSLSPERIDLCSAPLAAAAGLAEQPLLLIALASIDATTLAEQISCIRAQAQQVVAAQPHASGLSFDERSHGGLQPLLEAQRGQHEQGCHAEADWLLRLVVPPAQCATLLAAPELRGVPAVLAAGRGSGDAWAAAADLPRHRVEALRRLCLELGGHLTVLRQPAPAAPGTAPLPAWLDAPAKPMIEAIKREFDPKLQLARGRLPGVQG
ncbi:MAG: FAD-binding oxidoreductase [Cyanobacteriota bacterium]|nr:FAD-binding oxidoreductase [Cyanobacteriota bacterium]